MKKEWTAAVCALLAAVFYACSAPFSKILLNRVPATFMASFLYLGAGVGVGVMYLFHWKHEDKAERLTRADLPYTVGMIVLDILAPILLMVGIDFGTAANASLLGNFEIVATTLIALLVFRERVTKRLWTAILFTFAASVILSFEEVGSLQFSVGSLFVIAATVCWGLENNCTRKISERSTYQIVVLKGLFSGAGSFAVALLLGEKLPSLPLVAAAMLIGYIAYGLSIFLYIRAQRDLGAAKTSAYYTVAPFVGAFLSFLILREPLTVRFLFALGFMLIGTVIVVLDTVAKHHTHAHEHTVTHTHDGSTHTHVITHTHGHDHYREKGKHSHRHSPAALDRELQATHR